MTVIVEPHSMSPRIAVEDVTSPARDELDVALIRGEDARRGARGRYSEARGHADG